MRLATQVTLPCFLSSVASSSELVLKLLLTRLYSSSGGNDLLFTAAVDLWRQQTGRDQLPEFIVTQTQQGTLDLLKSSPPSQAGIDRLLAAAAPHSGAFLQTLPSSALGTRLDASLRIAVALRLGAPVCTPHKCVCDVDVHSSGVHGHVRRARN